MQTSDRARLFNPVWIFDFNFIEKQICLMLNSIFYGGFLNLDCDLFLLKNRIAIKVNLLVKWTMDVSIANVPTKYDITCGSCTVHRFQLLSETMIVNSSIYDYGLDGYFVCFLFFHKEIYFWSCFLFFFDFLCLC